MDSGSSSTPDYVGQAQATAQGNLDNLKYQTTANRPTIVTPWGTQSWTAPDASGQQTQTVTLTPDTQSALDSQMAVQKNQSQLAQSMQGQVANTMSTPFQAPSMSSYMSGTPSVSTAYQGFNPSGTGTVNQRAYNPSMYTAGTQAINQNAQGAVSSAGTVDQNTPQFSDATAQAGAQSAYDAAHGLIADQQGQDTKNLDSQLRLQGLTPGTEAYNTAAQNLSRTQAQQNDQLANQAVLTGNQMANANYASSLAGYQANLGAQNQAYSQAANTYGLGNAASTQSLNNGLAQYQAALQGQAAQNTAQSQSYNQALAGYGANQTAQQNYNAAQNQAYAQSLQNYNTAYNSAYQNYLTPLNTMNAVLNGNQVASPNFGSYSQSGYVGGADNTTAAQNAGQFNSAQSAASAAANNSTMSTIGTIGAAALMYY